MTVITTKESSKRIYEVAKVLTDPFMEGRLSGTRGAKRAAEYLSSQLNEIGYLPHPQFRDYLVPIEVFASRLYGKPELIIGKESFKHRVEFAEHNRAAKGASPQGHLLVIKDGVPFDENRLQGSVVLISEQPENFDLTGTVEHAEKYGVKAILIEHGDPKWFHKTVFGPKHPIMPVLKVTKSLSKKVSSLDGERVRISLPLQNSTVECQNVIGYLPGLNATETVVLSAHYDHLGDDPEGLRFPGAIDNASGVSAILETARKLKPIVSKLPFNVVVAFFSGEESGLHGAKQFLDVYREPIKAAINIDCIGQENPISLVRVGYESPNHWLPLVAKKVFEQHGIEIRWKDYGGEDSVAFRNKNIPALGLGQKPAVHKANIHSPEDDLNVINFAALATWAEITLELIQEISNMNTLRR